MICDAGARHAIAAGAPADLCAWSFDDGDRVAALARPPARVIGGRRRVR